MSSRKINILYVVYALTAVIFFIYYLFPSQIVEAYLTAKIRQAAPSVDITFGTIKPSLPPGIRFETVQVNYADKSVFTADIVKIRPGLFSLLGDTLQLHFSCDAYAGTISGRADIDREKGRVITDATFSALQLQAMQFPKEWMPHAVSGTLSGNFGCDIGLTASGRSAKANLRLSDAGVVFGTPLYGLEQLTFSEIETGLDLEDFLLKIERLTVKGPDVDGSVSGSIMVRRPVENCILNIAGELKPHPLLLDKLRKKFPVDAFMKQPGKNSIPFRVVGTPRDPRFSMR